MAADGRDRTEGGSEGGAADPFEGIDPKLTIYALANGMDLNKNGGMRRLEWYRDGHDRGILLAAGAGGAISLSAQAWKRGDEASMRVSPVQENVPRDELIGSLTSLLERGLEAANEL
jgi:hypothetical protein